MQNVDTLEKITLSTHWEIVPVSSTLISLPIFKSSSVFQKNLAAVEISPLFVFYDKPL